MLKTLSAVACIAIVGIAVEAAAQRGDSVSRVQQRSYRLPETNEKIEYDVFVSRKVDKRKPSPLVIALHGQNMPPLGMMRYLTEAADKGGYIVATPTGYNLQGWYGANGPRSPSTKPENLGELSEKDVMNVLDLMRKEFVIDDHRIYLLGQSMGGGGAMHLGVKYSDIWAAVGLSAPAMSLQTPAMLENIKDMPVILVHGTADTNVLLARIVPWANKMRDLKMKYEYYELPGVGHSGAIEKGAARIFAFFDKYSKS